MRDEYIKQLVGVIKSKKRSPQELQVLKEDALIWGATQEEFNEAIKRSISDREGKRHGMKRLLVVDAGLHVILLLVFGVFAIILMRTFKTQSVVPQSAYSVSSNIETIEKTLLQPAYAKTVPVDVKKVFSYSGSPITLAISGKPKREIYGFFPYWMMEAQENVSLDTVTDLALFGLTADGDGNIITTHSDGKADEGWEMWNNPETQKLIARANAKKISVEITFKAFNKDDITHLVLSDKAQKTFIANAIHLVQVKALNGINIDFEYHGTPNSEVSEAFTRFISNLRAELTRQIPKATLSISTYANAAIFPGLVDVSALSGSVDRYIIMGYDFHTPSGSAGPIAPLQGTASLTSFVQSYLEKVPASKLILALPYYGYDWAEGTKDQAGQRILPYASIIAETKQYPILWDEQSLTPWYTYVDTSTNVTHDVHFEDVRSLSLKYDYINTKNLRGVGIWALGYDGRLKDLQLLLQEKFIQ